MSRKYSVLFVALALVVAMAAGAWAVADGQIVDYTGTLKNMSNAPNQKTIDAILASADVYGENTFQAQYQNNSEDLTQNADLFLALSEDSGVKWYFDGSGTLEADSADIVLFYVGDGDRKVLFTAVGSNDVRADYVYSEGAWTEDLFGFDFTMPASETVDREVYFGSKPCTPGGCLDDYSLLKATSEDVTGDADEAHALSADTVVHVYVPCGNYEKEWQIFPHDMNVHPWDMVRLDTNLQNEVYVDLGYYVVERTGFEEKGDVEPLVERVRNKHGLVATARANYFDFVPLGESKPGQYGFRTISADATSKGDVTYLQYQEWTTERVSGDWFSWIGTRTATDYTIAFGDDDWGVSGTNSIAPGFSRYYAVSGDFTNADPTEVIDMCFEGNPLCQYLYLDPQVWSRDSVCDFAHDYENCWHIWPMSADERSASDLADTLGMAEVKYLLGSDIPCDGTSCEGHWEFYFEKWVPENLNASVCTAVEFEAVLEDATCNQDELDVALVRLTAELRQQRVCDGDVVKDITAALNELASPARPAHLGPADAFLDNENFANASGHNLQVVLQDNNGFYHDLADLAKKAAAEWESLKNDVDYQPVGVKNFFEVWAERNEDAYTTDYPTTVVSPDLEPRTVKEAWDADSVGDLVNLSFYVAVINADAPAGGKTVEAHKGYFIFYAGDKGLGEGNNYRTRVATVTKYQGDQPTPEPKDPEIVSITSDPQGSVTDVACVSDDELTKDSFSDAAWTSILTALSISDEDDYLYDVTCKDCDDYVVSLDAGLSLDVKVTYEEGEPAPAAGTYRSVFVKDVANSLYDVLAAEELAIAVEKDVQGVIFEGGDYDADASDDTLKAGFCLLQVVATPKTDTPTTTPSGDGGSSGCSFGFAPLALLLLAPLALLRK